MAAKRMVGHVAGGDRPLTYDDYVLFPDDGKRHEILQGQHYVTPSPITGHQEISIRISVQLYHQIEDPDLGSVYYAPTDLVLSDTDIIVPDILVVLETNRSIITEKNIRGETGTGEDELARALHRRSSRASDPFMAVHCASLPGELFEAELFEAELFGAEAGAYTGAEEDRPGLLETLAGGTILLDGIDSLPLGAQAKLLHVFDTRTCRRLGSTSGHTVDVRFLTSTTEDLAAAVDAGRFRPDLFYRVSGVSIERFGVAPSDTPRSDGAIPVFGASRTFGGLTVAAVGWRRVG